MKVICIRKKRKLIKVEKDKVLCPIYKKKNLKDCKYCGSFAGVTSD